MTRRGDVVIVRFPYAGGGGYKVRPAVVVQCDRLNRKIDDTIVVMVTSNLKRVRTEPAEFLIDPSAPDGSSSGLTMLSAVKCQNLATIPQADILDTIGHLSDDHKAVLNGCLQAVLELP